MRVKIKETNEVGELSIIGKNGIEWTNDLIGNAGAFPEQFEWSEEDDAYLAEQATFDWWHQYIIDSEKTDAEITSLAEATGIDEADIFLRVSQSQGDDYERHRDVAKSVINEILKEAA